MDKRNFMKRFIQNSDVEWKTLNSIALKISSGGTPKTGTDSYYGGQIPWLRTQEVNFNDIWGTSVKITEEGLNASSAKWIPENCVILAMYGATVGRTGINKIPMTTNQACANIQINPKIANYRYVFHFLSYQYKYIKSLGSGPQTNINAGIVKALKIPIPHPDDPEKSLTIQAEIVHILDSFTQLTAELTAELTARKKQYDYYRSQLLTFEQGKRSCFLEKLLGSSSVDWKPINNLTNRTKGTKITAGRMKEINKIGGAVKIFAGGKTVARVNHEDIPAKDVYDIPSVIVKSRGIIEFEYYDKPFSHKSEMWSYNSNNPNILTKYIYYILKFNEQYFQKIGSNRQMPQISLPITDKYLIPIPCPDDPEKSLAIQAEIVRILDKFDKLTTSLSEGLPREIELRQKQYEYYRNLLFSFPKNTQP